MKNGLLLKVWGIGHREYWVLSIEQVSGRVAASWLLFMAAVQLPARVLVSLFRLVQQYLLSTLSLVGLYFRDFIPYHVMAWPHAL